MPATLLPSFVQLMTEDQPPSYLLNKQFNIYDFIKNLFNDIESKRSSLTAITKEQAAAIKSQNLQFSATKHESRINCFYRMIGLPTELSFDSSFKLSDAGGNQITNSDDLAKTLVHREETQLFSTFKQELTASNETDLIAQVNSTQEQTKQRIAQLFDPRYLKQHTDRLFPMVQFSQVQHVVELPNRIAPSFASMEERFVGNLIIQPPFLESVIAIRLLPQSGGQTIDTQGAAEDVIIQALAHGLADLARRFHENQAEAEKHILDGAAFVRNLVSGVNSPLVKQADQNANTREPTSPKTQEDTIEQNKEAQNAIFEAAVSLLPTENDIIPIDISIDNIPLQSRGIKENALTHSFLSILTLNTDALQRSIDERNKVLKKRQLIQDKLTAEVNSIVGDLNGISLAEIIIVIAALFIIDEEDLVGLLSKNRFNELLKRANASTSTSNVDIQTLIDKTSDPVVQQFLIEQQQAGQSNVAQKQANIFNVLAEFATSKSDTTKAVQALEDTTKAIYETFVDLVAKAHELTK